MSPRTARSPGCFDSPSSPWVAARRYAALREVRPIAEGALEFCDAGLDHDVAEHRHLFGHALHVALAGPGRHLEPGLGQSLTHVGLAENLKRDLFQPAYDLGRRLRRRHQRGIRVEYEIR